MYYTIQYIHLKTSTHSYVQHRELKRRYHQTFNVFDFFLPNVKTEELLHVIKMNLSVTGLGLVT